MMHQTENFTMRISPSEREMLTDLAKRLQRSQSDTVRLLVREYSTAVKEVEQSGRPAILPGGLSIYPGNN